VPAKTVAAPLALAAGEIDFTNDTASQQLRIVRFDDFTDKLVPRRSAKSVVASLKFEIRVANAARQKPDERKTACTIRTANLADVDTPIFQMNREHE
jgi:hypothetical protein